jgi:hypothetical protein
MPTASEFDKNWSDFITAIGLTFLNWQKVEHAHYLLFNKMAQVSDEDTCSVLYYSPPSFESRRTLVTRIAGCYLSDDWNKKYTKLNGRLEKASTERNYVAHYSLNPEVIFEGEGSSQTYQIGPPRLTPIKHNKVDALKGRTAENETHVVTVAKMYQYCKTFSVLADDLKEFILAIPDQPHPKRPTANRLADIMLGPRWQRELRPNQLKIYSSDDAP